MYVPANITTLFSYFLYSRFFSFFFSPPLNLALILRMNSCGQAGFLTAALRCSERWKKPELRELRERGGATASQAQREERRAGRATAVPTRHFTHLDVI